MNAAVPSAAGVTVDLMLRASEMAWALRIAKDYLDALCSKLAECNERIDWLEQQLPIDDTEHQRLLMRRQAIMAQIAECLPEDSADVKALIARMGRAATVLDAAEAGSRLEIAAPGSNGA